MASYLTVYTTELRRMTNKPTQNVSHIAVYLGSISTNAR